MTRTAALAALLAVTLVAGCANENGAIPLDRDTWTTNTTPRGKPYTPSTRNAAPASVSVEGAPANFRTICLQNVGNPQGIAAAIARSGRYGPGETVGTADTGLTTIHGRTDNMGAAGYSLPGSRLSASDAGCFVGEGNDIWSVFADGRVTREALR